MENLVGCLIVALLLVGTLLFMAVRAVWPPYFRRGWYAIVMIPLLAIILFVVLFVIYALSCRPSACL